jgi:hypothetical protein
MISIIDIKASRFRPIFSSQNEFVLSCSENTF